MNRTTANNISSLNKNEVFVFGSNIDGFHGGGAARLAFDKFGAIYGQGYGLQGQSFAIPTMFESTDPIVPYVNDFIRYAKSSVNLKFFVTEIGCGIAGFIPKDIAPLFKEAMELENVYLPEAFWEVLNG